MRVIMFSMAASFDDTVHEADSQLVELLQAERTSAARAVKTESFFIYGRT